MNENLPDTNVGNIEYIRREDALDALPKPQICEYMDEFGAGRNSCAYDAEKAIEDIPAADVVPVVHGRWVDVDFCGQYECSECGNNAVDLYDFCPNCGAKMDGGDEHG